VIRILTSRQIGRLLERKAARLSEAEATVRPILEDVKRRGDRALMEYARRFDGLARRSVRVPAAELAQAQARLAPPFRKAVAAAARNIRAYARAQMPRPWRRKFAPASNWASSCGRSIPWPRISRRAAIPCPPRCS